jgi:hypothetical protein
MPRRFPPPWTIEEIPGGLKVLDANGLALAYILARDSERNAGPEAMRPRRTAARLSHRVDVFRGTTRPQLEAPGVCHAWPDCYSRHTAVRPSRVTCAVSSSAAEVASRVPESHCRQVSQFGAGRAARHKLEEN